MSKRPETLVKEIKTGPNYILQISWTKRVLLNILEQDLPVQLKPLPLYPPLQEQL